MRQISSAISVVFAGLVIDVRGLVLGEADRAANLPGVRFFLGLLIRPPRR
jgi:hypothetical protein